MKMCLAPRTRWLALALSAMVGFAASPNAVRADQEIFTLAVGNSAVSPFPGPYGTITVTLPDGGGNAALISFMGNTVTSGGHTYVYEFGDGGTVGVNSNGDATTGSFNPSNLQAGKPGNEDGFGKFNNTVDNGQGAAAAISSGSFVLTKTTGTWTDAANVLTDNGSGNEVAAHIFVFEDGVTTAAATGFAAPGVVTPEFGSVTLMSIMLLGFGGITGFRRLRKPAVA